MKLRSQTFRMPVALGIVVMALLAAAVSVGPVSAAGVPGRIGVDYVSALAIDPHAPGTVYAGACGTAVKSTDGGDSWIAANTGLPTTVGSVIAIDPITSGTLYAGTGSGLFKSADSATTWSAVNTGLPSGVQALAIDPVTPSTLYVYAVDSAAENGGMFRSTDGGSSWRALNLTGLPYGVGVFAIDPLTPGTLYAGTGGRGVFKSTDAGSSWTPFNTGLTDTYVDTLTIDPITPRTLYAGTGARGVFKSTDGAISWHAVNTGLATINVGKLAIDPTAPGTLYAGTHEGGVFKTTDSAMTWYSVNTGLSPDAVVYSLAIDPTTPSTLYAVTYDGRGGAVFKSTNSAGSWHATGVEGGAICGDGVQCGVERCDDGNLVDGDGCDANCTATRCGNGIVSMGEECDDGNPFNGDGCDTNCTPTACGNGIASFGEECDDGNLINGDACDANCTVKRCGNHIVDAGEACDDGNHNPFDGCTKACTICGNGIVTAPEECEDGNTNPSDGCTNACTVCGNGIVTAPEECDDGNLVDGDGCEANCHSGCGNGVQEGDEDCDDGGTCIGSANAGTPCTADTDCPGGHCLTFGGDGCAANCTLESDVAFTLVPGVVDGPGIATRTSGTVIHGDILTIPLPFSGSQTLTIGTERDGHIPAVIKAPAVHFARVPVGTNLGCACPRAVAAKTCGGTMLEADGMTPSPDCTPSFTAGDGVCAGKPPCTFVHGPGNAASGVIGCNGLEGVDVRLTQDGGLSGVPRPPLITLSGTGAAGSALLFATTATGGGFCYESSPGICGASCTGTDASVYGPDGEFCTDDDPQSQRGSPATLRVTTGTASGQVFNANMIEGDTICDCGVGGAGCGPSACTRPFSAVGHTFDCSALAGGSATGAALASVSVDLARPTTGDVVTTTRLVAPGGPPPPCFGDCNGGGQVTVDELLIMVNIALGNAQPSGCPHGVPSGGEVNIALIIQAVNHVLSGCDG